MKQISMHELYEQLGELKASDLILDVRSPEEFEQDGHIEGALNIPHDEVVQRAEALKKYDRIFIHCRMGPRAVFATQSLAAIGFKNLICIGTSGMVAWTAAGYPVVHTKA